MSRLAKYLVVPLAIGCALAHSNVLQAATYPDRPIRIIVPYVAGGGTDAVARIIGQKLNEVFGRSVFIDNRPGGATIIGSELAAKASPDGYTLLLGSTSQAVNVSLYSKMPYDPVKDLAPITLIGTSSYLLVIHPSLPVTSARQLIALAKSKPGQLTYASAGIASAPHLAGELFKSLAGIDMVHIPYKGGSQAITDVIGGQVTMYFSSLASGFLQVKAGRLRVLGVTSAKRIAVVPDVPTIAEAVLPGYEFSNWFALLAPGATPQEIVARLNAEVVKVLGLPDVKERLADASVEIVGSSPQELGAFIKAEIAKNAKLVRSARIRAE